MAGTVGSYFGAVRLGGIAQLKSEKDENNSLMDLEIGNGMERGRWLLGVLGRLVAELEGKEHVGNRLRKGLICL